MLSTDLYWAVANSSSTAPTATISGASKWITQIAAYSGVDTTNPFSATPAENGTNETGTSATHTPPLVTNPDANGWAVASFCTRGLSAGSWTPDAALTERLDNTTSASSQIASCFDDSNGVVSAAAHSYTDTASASAANATMWLGFLKPASSGT